MLSAKPAMATSPVTVVKAVRLALSKAADKALGLAATTTSMTEEVVQLDPLLGMLDRNGLLAVLEGPEGALGMVMVEVQMLAAIVEVQTVGRVNPGAAALRRPTRTDAAMVEPMVDDALRLLGDGLAEVPSADWALGFRYGVYIDQIRTLGLVLEDVPYRVFRVSMDLGGGAKQGEILLAFPRDRAREKDPAEQEPEVHAGWAEKLQSTILRSEVQMTAVIHRASLPLSALTNWKVGDLVTLPASVLVNIRLEDAYGVAHGRAKLGQSGGFRAIRVLPDDLPKGLLGEMYAPRSKAATPAGALGTAAE